MDDNIFADKTGLKEGNCFVDAVFWGQEKERKRFAPRTPLTDSHVTHTKMPEFPATLPNGEPWPRISIITPSYNQGQFIEDMVQSVIDQMYPNVEHILVDGASTDGTLQVVEAYRSHFAHVISEPDKGQSDAINKGFNIATGTIFTWLNCDDQLVSGALYSVALAFYYSKADMVAGGCRIFSEDGTEQLYHLTSCFNAQLPLEELLDIENNWLAGQFFFQPEVMFTRELWERSGGFIDESLYYCMDYELWVRFAANGAKLHVIGSPVAHYRMHSEQKTVTVEAFRPELMKTSQQLREKYLAGKQVERRNPQGTKKMKIVFIDCGLNALDANVHGRLAQTCALAGHDVTLLCHRSNNLAGVLSKTLTKLEALTPDLVVLGNTQGVSTAREYLDAITNLFSSVLILDNQRDIQQLNAAATYKLPIIITDNRWLTQRTKEINETKISTANEGHVTASSVGIEMGTVIQQSKGYCRRLLGLSEDRFVILTENGYRYLTAAMELLIASNKINKDDFMIVNIGPTPAGTLSGKINTLDVSELDEIISYCSAADLFINTSADSFSQVMITAASCGTPVLSFDSTTVPFSPSSLANMIQEIYFDQEKRELIARTGQLYVVNEYSLYSSYRSFFVAIKKLGLQKALGISPAVQFPSSGSFKFRTEFVSAETSGCELEDLRERHNAFKSWFDALLTWRTRVSPLPYFVKHNLIKSINNKQIVVFGAGGSYLQGLKIVFEEFSIKPEFFIDNDPQKTGNQIDGISIYLPNKISSLNKDELYVFITSMYYMEIKNQLQDMGLSEYTHFLRVS